MNLSSLVHIEFKKEVSFVLNSSGNEGESSDGSPSEDEMVLCWILYGLNAKKQYILIFNNTKP